VNHPTPGTIAAMSVPESEIVLDQASRGYERWRDLPLDVRTSLLVAMAGVLSREQESVARQITLDMAKPITQARAEVAKTVDLLGWFAEHGPNMLADEPTTIGPEARIVYESTGVVLSVQPWNFPIWQPMRVAVPVLLGGNGCVIKPAPITTPSARLLERLWQRAGLPEGVFAVLETDEQDTVRAISHRAVSGVTVTGGTRAGSAIAAAAGQAIKKSTLELGGSDAFIVLPDADLDVAAREAVVSRFQNAGQVCIAAKRIIVHDQIHDPFVEALVRHVRDLTIGDPFDESTTVGPLARPDLVDTIEHQVRATLDGGATLVCGGRRLPGNFYEPTVLTGVIPGMACFDEEVFGPVAPVVRVADVTAAAKLANQTPFGLSASIWTSNPDTAADLAHRLRVGGVFVNRIAVSDPRIPIGGVGLSGYGRELSHFGVHEFTNPKVVWHAAEASR